MKSHDTTLLYDKDEVRIRAFDYYGIRLEWFTLMSHIQLEYASLLLADAAFAA